MTIADDRKQGGKKGRRADDRRGAKMNAGTGMQDREASARQELSRIRRRQRGLIGAITGFSIFVNLLMLTGPLYMLQIYDRVLGSGSEETLLVLSVLVAFLFLMMGLLDFARGRIAARVGARLQETLDGRVFRAALGRAEATGQPQTGLQDLESVQRLLAAPAFLALFDLPWTPLFIAAIFLFHPWLGYLALGGGAVLVAITLLNRARTAEPLADAARGARAADRTASQLQQDAELIRSLGMKGAALTRWQRQRRDALTEQMRAADRGGGYTVATKTLRLFLQSAMLGLGAYLVLQGQMTAGAMIAASILLGRALAPVEQTIGQWALIERAQRGWQALHGLLAAVPPERPRTPLPRPAARLAVNQLTLAPPGHDVPTLRGLSFRVDPGQAVGVIGPSGAGKSTLARALCGVWRPSGGTIRLDGAALDQYDPDVLGQLIGYLPQQVTLFDGTIADNIARLSPEPDIDAIHRAAAAAAADTDDPVAGERLRHGRQRGGRTAVRRADAAHRAGPCAVRRSGAAGAGRAQLEPRQRGLRGAECRDPAGQGGRPLRPDHGPPPRRHRRMRHASGAGRRARGRLRPARRGAGQDGEERPRHPGRPRRRRRRVMSGQPQRWRTRGPVLLGMVTLAVLVFGFGAWAVGTTIAGAVVVSGRIQVDENRQAIQHPDGGVVAEIAVEEADTVEAGALLLRLDPADIDPLNSPSPAPN